MACKQHTCFSKFWRPQLKASKAEGGPASRHTPHSWNGGELSGSLPPTKALMPSEHRHTGVKSYRVNLGAREHSVHCTT